MSRYLTFVISCVALTAACATGTRVMTAGGEVAPLAPINRDFLPAGTEMTAKLDQTLATASSHSGDTFSATVVNPVYAQDGMVAVPAGSVLHGRITGIHNATTPGQNSLIRLAFEDIQMRGKTYPLTASVSNVAAERQAAAPTTVSPVRGAVAGAATGAVIGGVVSGAELSKILKGGLLGAAVGTVISVGAAGTEGVMPVGSTLTVRSNEAVRIR